MDGMGRDRDSAIQIVLHVGVRGGGMTFVSGWGVSAIMFFLST